MKISSKFSLALLAGTILSTPANYVAAATLTPTLDTIKAEAADLSGNFALTKLTDDLQEGAAEVEIAGVKYYFTPTGDDAALLKTLAGTVAGNLKEDENGIFEFDGKKYGFDVAAIPASVFEYAEGTAEDYNFTIEEADTEGNITTKYYKVVLKPEYFATSESIKWGTTEQTAGDATGSVEVKLPNNQTQTFYYAYTKPEGYETEHEKSKNFEFNEAPGTTIDQPGGAAINNSAGENYKDIKSRVFANNKATGSITGGTGLLPSSRNWLNLYGGAIYNAGEMRGINADFINNSVVATGQRYDYAYAYGGAIYNAENATIGDITGDFIGNYAQSESGQAYGGAIYNDVGTIGDITGDFIGNYASGSKGGFGGAINNYRGTIGDITGDFIGNYAGDGGTIYNDGGAIGDITGDFIGNYAVNRNYYADKGGAIYNSGTIGDITGDFIGNYASGSNGGKGGAIFNNGTIGNITGDFIGNYASGNHGGEGGAINNYRGTIGDITGDFIGNYAQGINGNTAGGAIYNYMGNFNITGNILNNYAQSENAQALGGAIVNQLGNFNITGNILNNYAQRENGTAYGGAILSTIGVDENTMKVTTPSVSSKGQDIFLSGNYTEDTRGKIYNALHVMILPEEIKEQAGIPADTVDFAFDTTGGGSITINDNIDGSLMNMSDYFLMTDDRSAQYNLAFRGDDVLNDDGRTTQYIAINNDIINAGKVTVEGTTLKFGSYDHQDENAKNSSGHGRFVATLNADGTADLDAAAVTSLSLTNAAFDLYNGYTEMVNLKGWSASNSYLHVDVNIATGTADVLNIAGDVVGQTKVIVYADSEEVTDKSILFATATGEAEQDANAFSVYRVYNSPYMFDVAYNPDGENGKEWSLTMTDEENEFAGVEPGEQPDPEVPDVDIPDIDIPDINIPTAPVYGEVVAYGALPAAALEQTRNMVDNVGGQVAATRTQDAAANYNLWVNPTYYTSNIDSPFAIDADIWGIEAGGDIQRDIHNRLGIFVSYRQGEYDMDGNGDKYRSPVGSEIDIDSYIAGLYYRYDNNNWYAFATLYGGIQEADIKTDDGVKSDTDGVEFGASVEAGYDYALTDSVTLTPELGVFYTQVNYDDAKDNVGKSASYDDARQIELEAGVKLAKTFMLDESFANVYVKPSVVQTIVDGDEVNITGLGDVEALDDATLGRIEIGGRYGFTTNLSAYGWANYTFGSDYDATTFGLGLNYAF